MRKSRYVLCNFSGEIVQLETFCLTQTCYDVHELSFKEKNKGLPQMDCGVDTSGMYRAARRAYVRNGIRRCAKMHGSCIKILTAVTQKANTEIA